MQVRGEDEEAAVERVKLVGIVAMAVVSRTPALSIGNADLEALGYQGI